MVFILGGWRMISRRGRRSIRMKVAAFNPMKFNLNNNNNNKLKKKKKKKKKMIKKSRDSGGYYDDGIIISEHSIGSSINSSVIDLLDDDSAVCEILTRLPVKSLVRFKCVCKRWCSLIQQDQHFIDLHLTRSKTRPPSRIFIVVPVPKTKEEIEKEEQLIGISYIDTWPYKRLFITADLLFEDKGTTVVLDTVREMDSSCYNNISKPVNGLICLIDSKFLYAVRICNISTREVSPWIQSTLLEKKEEEEEEHGIKVGRHRHMLNYNTHSSNYQFGFDPATNEHKLVCVWSILGVGGRPYYVCEVLTVGRQGINSNNTWRRIDEVPPYQLMNASVYVNGFIYWSSFSLTYGLWVHNGGPVCIVAFDVGSEKFRAITVPDFILKQPRDHYKVGYFRGPSTDYFEVDGHVDLLEVDGRLAMLTRMTGYVFKMYIFEDDYKETNTTSTSSSSSCINESWTEVTITLPFYSGENQRVQFHTVRGSDDKIILISHNRVACREKLQGKKSVSFYSYNWKKGTLTEFEVSGIPSSIPHLCTDTLFTTFAESLLPLNNHNAL